MKKILLILSILISTISLSQVSVVGNITTNGAALYPTHIDSLQRGGFRVVTTIVERNAITDLRRKIGMLVYVNDSNKTYKLTGGITNSDWTVYYDAGVINNKVDTLYRVNDSTVGYTINGRAHTFQILGSLSGGGGGPGSGIISLNTLTTTTQVFAVGTSGLSPNFSSAVSTHTLNIPSASSAGVTLGGVSNSDYLRWNDKLNFGDTAAMLGNYVRNSRSILTGYGLTGGGDLSANRTLITDSATLSLYYLRRKDSATGINPNGYLTRTNVFNYIPAQFNPIAGANITITGTYPNITFTAAGGGGGGVTTIGALNGGTASVNGGSISGSTFYFQTPDTVLGYPGLMTAQDKRRLYDSVDFLFAAKTNYTALGTTRAPRTVIVKGIQIAVNGTPLSPVAEGDSLLKWDITASTTGGGIHAVYNGWGLGKTNDSTLYADSSTLSGYYLRRKDSATTSNLNGYLTRTRLGSYSWLLNGNTGLTHSGYSSPYFGTNDSVPLVFRMNGNLAGYIGTTADTRTSFGSQANLNSLAGGGGNTAFGWSALKNHVGGENTAFGLGALRDNIYGWRNTIVGEYGMFQGNGALGGNYSEYNAGLGTFVLEVNARGSYNSAVGGSVLRGNKDGKWNAALGYFSLLFNSTVIDTVLMTSGGSYTSLPTVTFSSPDPGSAGSTVVQATGHAAYDAGSSGPIHVIMDNVGKGYSNDKATVTVTFSGGTGTAATGTPRLSSGDGNTGIGDATAVFHLYDKFSTFLGYYSGYADGTASATSDSLVAHLGAFSGRASYVPTATRLINSTSVGPWSRVGCSDCLVLGDSIRYTKVGINTTSPRKLLDVMNGDILVYEKTIGRGNTSIATNTVFGQGSLASNIVGVQNTALGDSSQINSNSSHNTTTGFAAGKLLTFYGNTVSGSNAMRNATTSYRNVSVGVFSSYNMTTGNGYNTIVGPFAAYNMTSAIENSLFGDNAGSSITTGFSNTAIGTSSMGAGGNGVAGTASLTGSYNIGLGKSSLFYNSSGSYNIGIGYIGLGFNTTGSYNVSLGGYQGASYPGRSKQLYIGNGSTDAEYMNGDSLGNIKIGAGNATTSAKLDIESTTRGLLIPRMTTTQMNAIASPATSLLIYNTDSAGKLCMYNGSAWVSIGGSGGSGGSGLTVGTTTIASGTNGYVLYNNSGVLGNMATSSLTIPINGLLPATAANTIDLGGYKQEWQWNSPSSVFTGLWLTANTTSSVDGGYMLNITQQGANAASGVTTYNIWSNNVHTGTGSRNVAGYFAASGGATNYSIITGSGNAGINTTGPNSKLHVNGSFATGYAAKSTTYTITDADYTIECTSGTFTVTLPTAVGIAGRMYFITNSGAGTITLATTSSEVFLNVVTTPTSVTIGTLTGMVVQSNGAAWLKVSSF